MKKIKLKNTPWTIIGYSRASRNTTIYIKELDIMLDAGMITEVCPSHIFISHAHLDHTREIAKYLIDSHSSNITVILPKPSAKLIRQQVLSTVRMTKHNPLFNPEWNVIETYVLKSDEPVYLPEIEIFKKMRFRIELFRSTHTISTTGYGFIEIRSRLKPEYLALTQEDINKLKTTLKPEYAELNEEELDELKKKISQDFSEISKKLDAIETKLNKATIDLETKTMLMKEKEQILINLNSILKPEYIDYSRRKLNIIHLAGHNIYKNIYMDVSEDIYVPHFCYLGDTDHKVLYNDKECTIFNKNIEKYSNILIECTFLTDKEKEKAKKNGHMLWKNLKKYIDVHPDNNFILYHFSMMYKTCEIIDFFEKLDMPNVTLLIHDFDMLFIEKICDELKDKKDSEKYEKIKTKMLEIFE